MKPTTRPLAIALVYVAVGALWIGFSDLFVQRVAGGPDAVATFQTIKGWGFVLVTGVVLYVVLRRRAVALRRAEVDRRASDTMLQHAVGSGPVVLYRLERRDGALVATWVSDSVEHVLGYTAEEALRPGWWFERVHPQDQLAAAGASAAVARSGVTIHEYRFRTGHGGYRWIRDALRTVGGTDPPEVLGAWLDVTEAREAQQALAAREAFYQNLIENASDSILVVDAAGTVAYANPAVERHTGLAPAAIIGRSVFSLVDPGDLPRAQAAFARAFEHAGEVLGAEYRARHVDGTWRHISSVGKLLPGDPPRLVVNSRDITESRTVEEQFRRAQRAEAIGHLTAGIVHDFNNVLSVVLGNVELLLQELEAAPATVRRDLEDVRRAALGGADMVGKLLGFSRQAALRLAPIDVRDVVRDVEVMLRRIVPPAISVRSAMADPLRPAYADAGAIQQVLLNLATNARDAMPDGGTLSIRATAAVLDDRYLRSHPWVVPGQYVRIAVADTGTGMDEATKERIFEPFFTTKPPGKGTGLGMPMIFGLVKQHGGYVDVETAPGAGTTVTIYLPAASADAAPERRTVQSVRGGTETIVLADDEAVLRRTAKRILEKLGYTVEVAEDGARCLEVLEARSGAADLVISDVQMPTLGGVELYHEIRRRGWDIPMLFSSGDVAHAFGGDGLVNAGFVQKPWTVEEIARAVRQMLDGKA